MKKYIPISEMLWFQEGPGVRNTQYTTSGVKLLNVANLINGELDITNTERYISEDEAYGRYKHFLVDEGDFIIASSGIKVEYFDKKMGFAKKEQLPLCMNTSTIRFKVLDKEQLSIRYFMYYLKSNHFKRQLNYQITGSAQLNFGPSHLKRMLFPIVGMEEQKQITEKMDALYAIEASLKKELNLFDELVKSRFIELFENKNNCKISNMNDICEGILAGGDRPKDTSEIRTKEYPYPVFANAATNEGLLCFSRNYKIDKPCVTIAARGCTVGFTAIRNERFTPVVRLISLIPKNEITPMYLKYFIDIKMCIEGNGAAQPQLTLPMIREMKISVPPLELQNKFAVFVAHVDKSKYYNFTSYKYCVLAANLIRQEWMLCQTLSF